MLLEVLLDLGVVLLDKIGVVGFLRCLSLTHKSRQRRQEFAEGMWKDLVRKGWEKVPAVWGADAEP